MSTITNEHKVILPAITPSAVTGAGYICAPGKVKVLTPPILLLFYYLFIISVVRVVHRA